MLKLFRNLLFVFILIFPSFASSQEQKGQFDIIGRSMRYPHYYKVWKAQTALGFSMVTPPQDFLEDAIQAPLVNFHLNFGLPLNLILEGDITTIIVSNQVSLGPRYNLMLKNFSANAGLDVACSFGFLAIEGFDNTTEVWSLLPTVSAGYKVGNYLLTAKVNISYITHNASKSGENEVVHQTNYFNGGSLTLFVEQRLWRNTVFVIGFKDNYLKYYWPTWMLFPTFNRYYHIPELSFSWIL